MSVLVVGTSHHDADLALLERLAVPADEHRKTLNQLLALDHVLEAAILSTCNRVEIYAHVARFHPGLDEIVAWMSGRAGDLADDFRDASYVHFDEHAARHLFSVAAGLDSMVVGEQQIAVQVKQAMEEARGEGASRRMLQRLFRQAVQVGRRVRRETEIGQGASSMVDIGLDDVAARLDGSLADRTALIVGAGKIGSLSAERLTTDGARVTVWNRSADKAARLAARVAGDEVDDLAAGVEAADVVVCTTGAPDPIITTEMLERRVADGRPVVLLDLAMPHNVDRACAGLAGVSLVGIADVRERARRTIAGQAIEAAESIVEEEAARFSAWMSAIEVEPTIRALRARAERIRQEELGRLSRRLSNLDVDQREAVEAVTRGIVNTFLHEPTIRLKELADAGGADVVADALRELFDLDEQDDEHGDRHAS